MKTFRHLVVVAVAASTLAIHASPQVIGRAGAAGTAVGTWEEPSPAAVPLTRADVCSLIDADAAQARITGQDGGMTTKVGDVTYWLFGDTTGPNGQWIAPNSIATSTATAPDPTPGNCIARVYKTANGLAAPLLPIASGTEENAVWPVSAVGAVQDRVHFFYQSVHVVTPTDFHFRFVGLASFATTGPDALNGYRLGGDPGGSSFWPNGPDLEPNYHVGSVQAVRSDDGFIYLFLGIESGTSTHKRTDVKLARVAPDFIQDRGQYEYWDADTGSFVSDLWAADALFGEDEALVPGQVSRNAFLGKWTMVYNGGTGPDTDTNPRHVGTNVSIRTADQPYGPWSSPSILMDCRARYPSGGLSTFCYAGTEQAMMQADGGQTIYVTAANEVGGRLYLHKISLAKPVRQYAVAGQRLYCIECSSLPPESDEGVAFFASDVPGTGLHAIHEFRSQSGEVVYVADGDPSPPAPEWSDQGVAFYARTRADASVWDEPVYQWNGSSAHVYSQNAPVPDYTRGNIAFYAACPVDSDFDGINDCRESMQAVEDASYDGDRDGCPDAREVGLVPPTDPLNPWDFYSVPVPALIAAPEPLNIFRDAVVGAGDSQAVFAYFKAAAKLGSAAYDQDLNQNGIADGVEYDRRVMGPGKSGSPNGVVTASDAQLAFAQFNAGYSCQ